MASSMSGFGDVAFRVMANGNGPGIVNDWVRASYVTTRHVPGSNATETFTMGRDAPQVTYRIEAPSFEEYQALDALVQTTATLRIPHGVTLATHTEVVYYGDVYDEMASVLLVDLANIEIRRDGTVRADATFQGSW